MWFIINTSLDLVDFSKHEFNPVGIDHRDLAMICGNLGRYASAQNFLSQWNRFLLERDEAETIIADLKARVSKTWRKVARTQGVSDADCEAISGAFVYPGFAYALQAA